MYLQYFALVNSYSQLKQCHPSPLICKATRLETSSAFTLLWPFPSNSFSVLQVVLPISNPIVPQTTEIENDQFHVYIIPNITVALENIQGTSNHLPSSSH